MALTDNGWNTDDAQEGDFYSQEIRAGRYALYIFHSHQWVRLTTLSHDDTAFLVAAMQYLGTTESQRNHYRPQTPASNPPLVYLPDDMRLQSIRAGRIVVHRYDGQEWQEQATLSAEDADILASRYRFLYMDTTTNQHYYRHLETEVDTIDDAIQAERSPDSFTEE